MQKTCNRLGTSSYWASASLSHLSKVFVNSFNQCLKFFPAFGEFGSVSNFSGLVDHLKKLPCQRSYDAVVEIKFV